MYWPTVSTVDEMVTMTACGPLQDRDGCGSTWMCQHGDDGVRTMAVVESYSKLWRHGHFGCEDEREGERRCAVSATDTAKQSNPSILAAGDTMIKHRDPDLGRG